MSMRETERRRAPPMAAAAQGNRLDDVLRAGASAAETGQGGAWPAAMRLLNQAPGAVQYPGRNGVPDLRPFRDTPREENALTDRVSQLLQRDAPTTFFEGRETTYHFEDGKLNRIDVAPTTAWMGMAPDRLAQGFSIVPTGRLMRAGRYTGWRFEIRYFDETVDVYESDSGDYSKARLVSTTYPNRNTVFADEYAQRAQTDSEASAFLIRLMIYTAGFLAALDFAARKTLR